MPIDTPDATSTPTTVPRVKGRVGIRDHDQNSIQSPIEQETIRHRYNTRASGTSIPESTQYFQKSPSRSPNKSPRSHRINRSDSSDLDASSDGEYIPFDASDSQVQKQKNQPTDNSSGSNSYIGLILLALVAIFVVGSLAFKFTENSKPTASASPPETLHQQFSTLEKTFNKQDEDFWSNIRVNIQEIPVLKQPRAILFVYNHKGEETMNKILRKVSDIALCNLTACSNHAIVIEGSSLNTSEIVNDYGKIISKYHDSLEENGVMVVKNLEKVPGVSAQAFHSICDDYHPLVKKALILFTLKVKSLPEGYPMKFVENFLSNLWNDIGKDDKFYPLFTRISSTILTVRPE